jgi:hypothetical protein
LGTKEDGVDKAGRAREPSVMVAPSGRDINPDEEAVKAAADEVVSSPDEVVSSPADGADAPASPASSTDTGQSLWRDTHPSSESVQPPSAFSGTATRLKPSASPAPGYASSATAARQDRTSGAKRKRDAAAVRRSARRQAMLTLVRVEPWSVMKFSFVVSAVAFIILFVAVAVLYVVLSALGVFGSLQHLVSTLTSSQNSSGTNISHWLSASRILGYTGMLGALNIVLITAISTIGAVIYNLIAHTLGGIEVTLRETE